MRIKLSAVIIFLAFLMAGCQKDEVRNTIIKQEVTFNFDLVDPMGLKNDDPWNFDCPEDDDGNLLIPTIAEIVVKDSNDDFKTFYPLVFTLNGNLYTQSIKLEAGTYELTKVMLLDGPGGNIIMATPAVGGLFAQYVSNPLAFEFEVSAFTKAQLEAEVLCYSSEKVGEFGFLWLGLTEIVVRQFCFFGNICANGGIQYQEETAYGGDFGGGGSPWWYYYDQAGQQTQNIYAGQQITDGTVTYQNNQIIINLGSSILQDDEEAIKIKGFNTIPSSPHPLGLYPYKGTQLIWDVAPYQFYIIHIDLLVGLPSGSGSPYGPQDFVGSDYEDLPGGLEPNMPAIFKIHVYRTFNGQTTEMPYSPFSNLGNENQELCVNYPDRIRVPGEEFSFMLYILVPDDNDGFEYQYYHTFTSTDAGPLSTDPGSDKVVEFILGNCISSPKDIQFSW
jgi:hypothetical protein